jgi:NAD(P)-dependent dehydrogenase (short-subunit alcohol dehydrogenase family)
VSNFQSLQAGYFTPPVTVCKILYILLLLLLLLLLLQEMIDEWKSEAQMKRPGQPCEVAPCYVFLASEDGSYISGQTLHPNGGTVVSG